MNDSSKEKMMIKAIINVAKNTLMIPSKKIINGEYKLNIGTSYKRSDKESNEFLRFKERFKRHYELAYGYAIESMGR